MDGLIVLGAKCQMFQRGVLLTPSETTTMSSVVSVGDTVVINTAASEGQKDFIPKRPYTEQELAAMLPPPKYTTYK